MQRLLENVFGIALLLFAGAFILNRLLVFIYFAGCVVHSVRNRDVLDKRPSSGGLDVTKFLNVWMVRSWIACLVSALLYGITTNVSLMLRDVPQSGDRNQPWDEVIASDVLIIEPNSFA